MTIEVKVYNLLKAVITELGYGIVRVKYFEYSKILQIMIEKPNAEGISVDDCEVVSNAVSAILDVEDPITSHYHLEISSAGLERPLVGIEDYIKFQGKEAKLMLHQTVDGVKKIKGVIEEVAANDVIMRLDAQQQIRVNFDNIVGAHLTVDTKNLFNKKRSYG